MGRRLRKFGETFRDLVYLARTGAGPGIIRNYAGDSRLKHGIDRTGTPVLKEFQRRTGALDLSSRWFDGNVALWHWMIGTWRADRNAALELLEIGSWEGLSANFMLWQFPAARLTCVDTWEGSDEHRDGSDTHTDTLDEVERRFDDNCRKFADRIDKRKMRSSRFLAEPGPHKRFDLVYIDGSHRAHDVMADALGASALVRHGGVIVFDDYLWRHHDNIWLNPAPAINWFIRSARDEFEILYVGVQVILRKRPARVASA